MCREKCPTGFGLLKLDDSTSHYTCARECFNVTITRNDNESSLKKYIGCKIVRGYLEINGVSAGMCIGFAYQLTFKNAFSKLLSSIVEIDGFLKISNSSLVSDLAFFTNLRKITGKHLFSGEYSLVVSGNENLNYLWSPRKNITINHGATLLEFNPKLRLHCQDLEGVKVKPNLYTANFSWTLPSFINTSEAQNYEIFIWNETKKHVCDYKR